MRQFTILVFAALTSSCVPHQKETPAIAQQPEPVVQPTAVVQLRTMKTVEKPAITKFNGHYPSWFNPVPESSGYGNISIHAVDEGAKRVSFSTMIFGKRNDYHLPFQITANGEQNLQALVVNTKAFNFSSNGKYLWIDLFEGAPQTPLLKIAKRAPFKYDTSKITESGRPVVNHPPFVKPQSSKQSYERVSETLENASKTLLEAKHLENLQAVDLEVMKNSIYARHGAAFEDRRMADFFAQNDWYIPIFTVDEVNKNLTKIEVKNIDLIGRFEKHAKRYYFGR